MRSLIGLENTWKEKLRESVTHKYISPAECVGAWIFSLLFERNPSNGIKEVSYVRRFENIYESERDYFPCFKRG